MEERNTNTNKGLLVLLVPRATSSLEILKKACQQRTSGRDFVYCSMETFGQFFTYDWCAATERQQWMNEKLFKKNYYTNRPLRIPSVLNLTLRPVKKKDEPLAPQIFNPCWRIYRGTYLIFSIVENSTYVYLMEGYHFSNNYTTFYTTLHFGSF